MRPIDYSRPSILNCSNCVHREVEGGQIDGLVYYCIWAEPEKGRRALNWRVGSLVHPSGYCSKWKADK